MFAWEGNGRLAGPAALRWLAAPAMALFVAACAADGGTAPTAGLAETVAQRTFAEGYRQISQRYIDPVSVETLALEGLNGLDVIDPKIDFKRSETRLHMLYGGRVAAVVPVAMPGDAQGWAAITMDALDHARTASTGIREANADRIYEAVFDGMLAKLDPFSRYAGAAQARENRAKRRGFGGIGVEFVPRPDGAEIVGVFPDTPAARVGLAEGDRIRRVDGASIMGFRQHRVRDRLRGAIGSTVSIEVARPGKPGTLLFELERAKVVLPTVAANVTHGVLHVMVSGFNHSTASQIAKEVRRARAEHAVRGVLLDLRNNPGGLLMQAVKVADLFLADGRIVSTRGRHPNASRDYDAHDADVADGLPMAVLINGRSASASEIVAAALQDHERAVVIGSASFGKGTVQTITRLPNDGEMTLTWSRFVAPSGYTIHELGLTPSVCTNLAAESAAEVIGNALDHAAGITDRMERWRVVAHEDHEERRRLRGQCPAKSGTPKIEQLVAERVLSEPGLYHRVMAMAPSLAASRP